MIHLDPKVIIVFFVKYFIGSVYILPFWFFAVFIFETLWTANMNVIAREFVILLLDGAGLIFLALLIAVSYYTSWLTYIRFSYHLMPDGLHIHSGTFIQKQRVILFSDIETAEVYVNPFIARFLNLHSLHIRTREISNTEGIFKQKQTLFIPGLTPETASSLRAELLRNKSLKQVKKTLYDPVTKNYR